MSLSFVDFKYAPAVSGKIDPIPFFNIYAFKIFNVILSHRKYLWSVSL